MPTRNVVLTEAQSRLIDDLVSGGRYQNASEALRAGLRLLEADELQVGALRQRLARAYEEAQTEALAAGTGPEAVRRAFGEAMPRRR